MTSKKTPQEKPTYSKKHCKIHRYFKQDCDKCIFIALNGFDDEPSQLSSCCKAGIYVHSEEEGTNYYICSCCNLPTDLLQEKFVTYTSTVSNQKYEDWLTNEIIEFVRNTPLETDAVENLKRIIERYERSKTSWQLFKQFLKS